MEIESATAITIIAIEISLFLLKTTLNHFKKEINLCFACLLLLNASKLSLAPFAFGV